MGSIGEAESLPYWQVNVPPSEREATCPEFLLDPNSKDLEILQTPDSQYHLLTWDELKAYIESNRLDVLQRKPSDLRRYIAFNHDIRKKFGSVMNFILQKKLGWEHPIEPSGAPPFENPEDWRVQWNDWPYGLDPKIVHLVVWTKFAFEEDASLGDLTPAGRKVIDDFVEKRFRSVLPREKILWFRNWTALKSVHAVEHFHLMLYDPDPDFVARITGGDIPLFKTKAFGGYL